jgi:predicted ArsR family transcriptional regulator
MARPDDVLTQPTRARLFALLDELKRPARTKELADRVGLHPNGVRVHLERLRSAGLITRTRVRQAVGRPRDEWSIAPEARPGGNPPSGYAQLVRWLARAIPPA